MSQHLLKICGQNNGRLIKWFFFATATTIQRLKNSSANNENIVKSNSFCVVDLEIVVFREGNCQVNRKFRAKPTLLERFYAEIKNKHG